MCGQASLERGTLSGKQMSGDSGWPFEFHIQTSNRKWAFRTRLKEERENWIQSIQSRWENGGRYRYSTMRDVPNNKSFLNLWSKPSYKSTISDSNNNNNQGKMN